MSLAPRLLLPAELDQLLIKNDKNAFKNARIIVNISMTTKNTVDAYF